MRKNHFAAASLCVAVLVTFFFSEISFLRPGPAYGASMAINMDDDDEEEETHTGIFPPVDRMAMKDMNDARKLVELERYADAVNLITAILDMPEDYYFPATDGSNVYRSLKSEAQQLIMRMPARGRQIYELQAGPTARLALNAAVASGKREQLGMVARKFFHTEAGYEAVFLLGLNHLDHNHAISAALSFQKLYDIPEARKKFDPVLTLLLAVSWNAAGMRDRADILFDSLSRLEKSSELEKLSIGGKSLAQRPASEDLSAWLQKQLPVFEVFVPRGMRQWGVMRGDLQRNATSDAGATILTLRWRVPMTDTPEAWALVELIRRNRMESGQPDIPQLFPLVVGDTVLMRTTWNLTAVDLGTGKRLWDVPAGGYSDLMAMLEKVLSNKEISGSSNQNINVQKYDGMTNLLRTRIWSAGIYGALASNGKFVYCIEDTESVQNLENILSGNNLARAMINRRINNNEPEDASGPAFPNRLCAYDIKTGKLAWHIGGSPQQWKLPASGTMFLGPPTPIGNELYIIAQQKGEIMLLVLEQDTGRAKWSQVLCFAPDMPITEAMPAFSPSYSEGILICPTPNNALVAVDIATHSILWAHQYAEPVAFDRYRMYSGQTGNASKTIDASVVIADGNVLYMPAEQNYVYCMRLVDGQQVWKMPARNAIYIASVYQGRAYLATAEGMIAAELAPVKEEEKAPEPKPAEEVDEDDDDFDDEVIFLNGRAVAMRGAEPARAAKGPEVMQPVAQKLVLGKVSGTGFRNGKFYFLPLAEGKIAKIDLPAMAVTDTATSREGNVPGNLIPANDRVLSQRADHLDAYQQLDSLDAELKRLYAQDEKHPDALVLDAVYRWDTGDIQNAVGLLREAVKSGDFQAKNLLLRALMEGVRENFNNFDSNHEEIQRLLSNRREKLEFQRFVILGLEKAGRLAEAVQECGQLMQALREPDSAAEAPDGTTLFEEDSLWQENPDQWLSTQLAKIRQQAEAKADGDTLTAIQTLVAEEAKRLSRPEAPAEKPTLQAPSVSAGPSVDGSLDSETHFSGLSQHPPVRAIPARKSPALTLGAGKPEEATTLQAPSVSAGPSVDGSLGSETHFSGLSQHPPVRAIPARKSPALTLGAGKLKETEKPENAEITVSTSVSTSIPASDSARESEVVVELPELLPLDESVPEEPIPPIVEAKADAQPEAQMRVMAQPLPGIKPIPVKADGAVGPVKPEEKPEDTPEGEEEAVLVPEIPGVPAFPTDVAGSRKLFELHRFMRLFRGFPETTPIRREFITLAAKKDLFSQAELTILQQDAENREAEARHWAEIVEMFAAAPRPLSAAIYYKYVQQHYGDVPCFNGKTPAEWLAALPADHAIHEAMKEQQPLPEGLVEVRTPGRDESKENVNRAIASSYYQRRTLEITNTPSLPFRDMTASFQYTPAGRTLVIEDGWGQHRWAPNIAETPMPEVFGMNIQWRITAADVANATDVMTRGHMFFAGTHAGDVFAVDFLADPPRVAWRWTPPRQQPDVKNPAILPFIRRLDAMGIPSLARGHSRHSSGVYYNVDNAAGPSILKAVNEAGVCFIHTNKIYCLDTLTGEILWERMLPGAAGSPTNISWAMGDDKHICVLGGVSSIQPSQLSGVVNVNGNVFIQGNVRLQGNVAIQGNVIVQGGNVIIGGAMPAQAVPVADPAAEKPEGEKPADAKPAERYLLKNIPLAEIYNPPTDKTPPPETPEQQARRRAMEIFRGAVHPGNMLQQLHVFDITTGRELPPHPFPDSRLHNMSSAQQLDSKILYTWGSNSGLYDPLAEQFDWLLVMTSDHPDQKMSYREIVGKDKIAYYFKDSRVQVLDARTGDILFTTPPLLPETAPEPPVPGKRYPKRDRVQSVNFYPDGEGGYLVLISSQRTEKEEEKPAEEPAEEEKEEKEEENAEPQTEEQKKAEAERKRKEEAERIKAEQEKMRQEMLKREKMIYIHQLGQMPSQQCLHAVLFRLDAGGNQVWEEPIFMGRSYFLPEIPSKLPVVCFGHLKRQRNVATVVRIFDKRSGRLLYDGELGAMNSQMFRVTGDPKAATITFEFNDGQQVALAYTDAPWGDFLPTRERPDADGATRNQRAKLKEKEADLAKLRDETAQMKAELAKLEAAAPAAEPQLDPVLDPQLDPVLDPQLEQANKAAAVSHEKIKELEEQADLIEKKLNEMREKLQKLEREGENEDNEVYADEWM